MGDGKTQGVGSSNNAGGGFHHSLLGPAALSKSDLIPFPGTL